LRKSIPFFVFLPFLLAGCASQSSFPASVVLYCSQDREFAEEVLQDFHTQTGIAVLPRFDTEANKSVSLYHDLVREADHPRCDVHWNNEIIATIRLQKKGLLEPYASPAAKPFPEQFKARDHTWHAFAARARILIVNTRLVPMKERPRSILDLTQPKWKGKIALAKPQFGTTATHAACLFQSWGAKKAKKFFRDLKDNDVRLVAGNKQVAEGVGNGKFAFGLTDTDDAMAEVRAGNPVEIIFPDQDKHGEFSTGTLFLPNTLALIRGSPNPEGGKKLIDFLLSPEVEKKLALSESAQIPLNPQVRVQLPPQMAPARTARQMHVDFAAAAELWEESQAFLTRLFGR
jgi:iron(III) transport system substrate-binding protein